MSGLDSKLYNDCAETLSGCDEFSSHSRLVAIFAIGELAPFKRRIHEHNSFEARVDWCISYLWEQRTSSGYSALSLFLKYLAERYDSGDDRHRKLSNLSKQISEAKNKILLESPTGVTPEPYISIGKVWLPSVDAYNNLDSEKSKNIKSQTKRREIKGHYLNLRNFLENRQWRDADIETSKILVSISNRPHLEWIKDSDIKTLPKQELKIIDHLWSGNSDQKFGFRSQAFVISGVLGKWEKIDGNTTYAYATEVGWAVSNRFLEHKDLNFDFSAPKGHLPSFYPIGRSCSPKVWRANMRAFLPLIVDFFA